MEQFTEEQFEENREPEKEAVSEQVPGSLTPEQSAELRRLLQEIKSRS